MAALEMPNFSWSNRKKGNYHIIKSELSGFCLQIEPTSKEMIKPVNLGEIEANNLNQLWRFNADHTIESAEGKFLDISGVGGRGNSICAGDASGRVTQKWHLTHKGELLNENGMYLTIKNGDHSKRAELWANSRKSSAAQRWICLDDVSLDAEMIDSLRNKLHQALALAAVKAAVNHDSLHCLFAQFDLDRSGVLEKKEIDVLVRKVMGVSKEELSDLNLKAFIGLVDTNNDGTVDFNEFTSFLGFNPRREEESGSEDEDDEDDDALEEGDEEDEDDDDNEEEEEEDDDDNEEEDDEDNDDDAVTTEASESTA